MEIAGRCFRVDANLRPEGRDGPLVRSLESYEAYWDRWAEPWEFQALLKARPVAGDGAWAARWLDAAQRWLWNHPFDADDLRSLRAMKATGRGRGRPQGTRPTASSSAGPGGIRDIEFTVQLLQLVHGHARPRAARSPTTLTTLAEMADGRLRRPRRRHASWPTPTGCCAPSSTASSWSTSSRSTPCPPTRRHSTTWPGCSATATPPDGTAAEQLEQRAAPSPASRCGRIHERVYFRPLLEAFADDRAEDRALSPEAAAARLTAFGFTDARRTQAAVKELTRGLNRSSRLMQQLLPLLLDWLSPVARPRPRPARRAQPAAATPTAASSWAETFRDSPEAAQALCTLAGTSRLLGDILTHNPDLSPASPTPTGSSPAPTTSSSPPAPPPSSCATADPSEQDALRRWNERNLLGIAARDVLGHADVDQVGRDLTVAGRGHDRGRARPRSNRRSRSR